MNACRITRRIEYDAGDKEELIEQDIPAFLAEPVHYLVEKVQQAVREDAAFMDKSSASCADDDISEVERTPACSEVNELRGMIDNNQNEYQRIGRFEANKTATNRTSVIGDKYRLCSEIVVRYNNDGVKRNLIIIKGNKPEDYWKTRISFGVR